MAGIMRCFAILFAALTLVVAGCRQDPYMEAYIDTLNLEKLALEDRLYELEYDYDKLLEKLKRVESDGSSPTRSPSGNSRPTPAEPPVRQPPQNTSPDKDASGAPEIDQLKAEGFVDASKIQSDLRGMRVQLTVELTPGKTEMYTGKIVFVSAEVEPVSRQSRIWAEIDNKGQRLKPGLPARMKILVP